MQQSEGADNPQPSIVELAWLAGFVDGEGNFNLNVHYRKGRQKLQIAPRVAIVNTSSLTIEYLHSLLDKCDIGHLITERQKMKPHHNQQWMVQIIGFKRCKNFHHWITPYLFTKRNVAELQRAYINYRMRLWQQRNGGRGAPYGQMGLKVHEAMKNLNHDEGSETVREALDLIEMMRQSELFSDK